MEHVLTQEQEEIDVKHVLTQEWEEIDVEAWQMVNKVIWEMKVAGEVVMEMEVAMHKWEVPCEEEVAYEWPVSKEIALGRQKNHFSSLR